MCQGRVCLQRGSRGGFLGDLNALRLDSLGELYKLGIVKPSRPKVADKDYIELGKIMDGILGWLGL